jgi:putative ABC transport system ATP-binding protein
MSVLVLDNIKYRYEGAKNYTLCGINAHFEMGKVYTILGKSGSGKSTMLSLIAGLDVCSEGAIKVNGEDIKKIDRDEYRSKNIGVIFQSFNLLTNATAVENIVLSMNISGTKLADKKQHAYDLLERVGINCETASRKVLKLSGGEQQRVGIARALSHDPEILVADEPTGNLDEATEDDVLRILTNLAHKDEKCVIIVTHSKKVANVADEMWAMRNGVLSSVKKQKIPAPDCVT